MRSHAVASSGGRRRSSRGSARAPGAILILAVALLAVALALPPVAAAHKPHVHQSLVAEALALYASTNPEGIVPGTFKSRILEGAEDEDMPIIARDHVNGFVGPFLAHFWDGDDGPDDTYDATAPGGYPNAWQKARRLWAMALGAYEEGRLGDAYDYLGHVAHLLGDMSVPAHVHNDDHAPWDADSFEEWMADHYRISPEDRTAIGSPLQIPAGHPDKLFWLFHVTNQYTDFFASNDRGGDAYDPLGWYQDELDALKAEFVGSTPSPHNPAWVSGHLEDLRHHVYVHAIRATTALFQLFEESVSQRTTMTVVIDRVAEQWVHDPDFGDPDYYAVVRVNSDGHGYGGMVSKNRGEFESGEEVRPGWAFSMVVPPEKIPIGGNPPIDPAPLNVEIEIWDWDELLTLDDDQSDITPGSGKTLDLVVDVAKCRAGSPDAVAGSGNDAGVSFGVNTGHRCGVYTYLPVGKSYPAASRLSFTIKMTPPANTLQTTTSLASSDDFAAYGQSVTWTATVQPADGNGSVSFTADGQTPIAGCAVRQLVRSGDAWIATCSSSALEAGTYGVAAMFSGSEGYAASGGAMPGVQVIAPVWTGGPVSFAPVAYQYVLGGPKSVAIGDLDGIAPNDLAVANSMPNKVSVLLANGDGSYTQSEHVVGGGPASVAIGRIDGDAYPDIVTADLYGETVSVMCGFAGGYTTKQYKVGSLADQNWPESVAIGNLDGLRALDLVTANEGPDSVSVLRANTTACTGGFTKTDYPVGSGPNAVAIGDLNGTGRLDLVTTNHYGDNVSVLLANAANSSFTRKDVAVGDGPQSVAIGDLNRDGRMDLVTANWLASSVSVLLADASGGYTRTDYAVGDDPYEVAIGDLNLDGVPDLATANSMGRSVSVLVANPGGGFTRSDHPAGTTGSWPQAVAIGDLDATGGADVATANYGVTGKVAILLNATPAKVATAMTVNVCTPPADVNGEPDPNDEAPPVDPPAACVPAAPAAFGRKLGDALELAAVVTPSDGSGTVEFIADGTPIAGCVSQPLALADGTYRAGCTTRALPVGTHVVAAIYSGSEGFGPSDAALPATVPISKAVLVVSAVPAEKTYGETDPVLDWTYSGFVLGQGEADAGITGSAACTRSPGQDSRDDYVITCLPGTLAADDYVFATGETAPFTIRKRTVAVDAQDATKDYSAPDPMFGHLPLSGFVVGEDAGSAGVTGEPVCTRVTTGEDVGTYPDAIRCEPATLQAPNYEFASGALAAFTIRSRVVEVSAAPKDKTYGGPDPELTYGLTAGSLNPGDELTGTLARSPGEDTGAYAITQGSLTAGPEYDLVFVGDELVIEPAVLYVDALGDAKVYGDPDPRLLWSYRGFVGGDLPGNVEIGGEAECSRAAGESVAGGPYAITCKPGSLGTRNYRFLTGLGNDLAIEPRPAEWTTAPAGKTYGTPDPVPLTTGQGTFLAADGVSATYSRAAGDGAGEYPITATLEAAVPGALANYLVTNAGSTFTIDRAALSVDAVAATKVYGTPDPELDHTLSGFVSGEDATSAGVTGAAACQRAPGETVLEGPYAIACEPGGLAAPNYRFAAGSAAGLSITPRPIGVTADALSKTYGDADPPLTYQVTSGSLVPGDGITGEPARDPGTDAGSYPIGRGSLSAGSNYDLAFVGADLVIEPAPLFVDAVGASKTYGEDDPAFTWSYRGFVTGEDADTVPVDGAAACVREAGEIVAGSPYPLACAPGSLSTRNYRFESGTLAGFTVTPAPLAVTPESASVTYGDPEPAYVVKADFRWDDGFLVPPACDAPDYVQGAAAGRYDVTCSGGDAGGNYAAPYAYLSGRLEVRPRALEVAAGSGTSTFGTASDPIGFATGGDGFFDGDGWVAEPGCAAYGSTDTGFEHPVNLRDSTSAGSYVTHCAGGDAGPSYDIRYRDGSLVVRQASAAIVYASPTYVLSADGAAVPVTPAATVTPAACGAYRSFTVLLMGTEAAASGTGPFLLVPGIYSVTAAVEANADCTAASDEAILTVASPSDASAGGGWYKAAVLANGSPRVNLGYTVQTTSKTDKATRTVTTTYKGQLLWLNNGQWRLKGSISGESVLTPDGTITGTVPYGTFPCPGEFTSTLPAGYAGAACGSLTGTGVLQQWDPVALQWIPSQYGTVAFSATMYDGGQVRTCKTTGKKTTCTTTDSPDWFGIQVDPVPSSAIRESSPMPLSGGSIKVK